MLGARLVLLVPLVVVGCESGGSDSLLGSRGPGAVPEPTQNGGGEAPPEPNGEAVVGASAGGMTHVISDRWREAAIRYGDNIKMLNFSQLKSEMARVTGATIDWTAQQSVFGGADFVATFKDDRTPSATKLVALRKLAFDACAKMIANESTKRVVFSAISPKAAIAQADPNVASQVRLLFAHVFHEEPATAEQDASLKGIADIGATGATPEETWTGVCVGYLTSTRFLAY